MEIVSGLKSSRLCDLVLGVHTVGGRTSGCILSMGECLRKIVIAFFLSRFFCDKTVVVFDARKSEDV